MTQTPSSEIYIGLMSGTSLDGIDVAIVDFGEFPPRLLYCSTTPYTEEMRQSLHNLCQADTTSLENLYGLDAELGELYAQSVNQALDCTEFERAEIAAIGCHGQTIRHSPDSRVAFTATPCAVKQRAGTFVGKEQVLEAMNAGHCVVRLSGCR